MGSSGEHKRYREEETDELESPEVKRLRADLLFDILDDDAGAGAGAGAGHQDLDSVIKSLEEEIALPSPPAEPQIPQELSPAVGQPDLGFLFEASDDELGLPPTSAQSAADDGGESVEAAELGSLVEPEGAGFGQIWGFDEEINGYEGLGLGIRAEEREAVAAEDGLAFDGGLFDYPDEMSGPYDLSDLSWRPESLPAV